jgi:hypothetical protein
MNNSRRGFIKNLGLFGGLTTAAYMGYRSASQEDDIPNKEVIEKMGETQTMLSIHSNYDLIPNDSNRSIIFQPQYKTKKVVDMKVGYDGKLYLRENGIWRKA